MLNTGKTLIHASVMVTRDLLLLPSLHSHAGSSNPGDMWDQAVAHCERCPKELRNKM